MKPSFQHLGFDSVEGSFLCFWVKSEKFGFHWHYHPECEISYVVNGKGTRLVGDNVEEFGEGDLIFLGSDLPHTLISDDSVSDSNPMEVLVIQFPKEIIEARALEISELGTIGNLINSSNRGLHFKKDTIGVIGEKIRKLVDLKGFRRYHLLLEILDDLGNAKSKPLASEYYSPDHSSISEDRIGKVCTYIHENYTSPLGIDQLADLANMNTSAFCRFFKKMTGKTAITYINDLRIGKACEMLHSDSKIIAEIAFESGYPSITHFNRSFIKRKGMTPTDFRNKYSLAPQ